MNGSFSWGVYSLGGGGQKLWQNYEQDIRAVKDEAHLTKEGKQNWILKDK